jgi:hypothetical protein
MQIETECPNGAIIVPEDVFVGDDEFAQGVMCLAILKDSEIFVVGDDAVFEISNPMKVLSVYARCVTIQEDGALEMPGSLGSIYLSLQTVIDNYDMFIFQLNVGTYLELVHGQELALRIFDRSAFVTELGDVFGRAR